MRDLRAGTPPMSSFQHGLPLLETDTPLVNLVGHQPDWQSAGLSMSPAMLGRDRTSTPHRAG